MSVTELTQSTRDELNGRMKVADIIGLLRCPATMEQRLTDWEQSLAAKRAVEQDLAAVKADHADNVALAEMAIGRAVTKEGNKTFIPDGDTPRQVTADEAKAWVARQVAQAPAVDVSARQLATATLRLEEARDNVAVAEARLTVSKYANNAAVATAQLLAGAFSEGTH